MGMIEAIGWKCCECSKQYVIAQEAIECCPNKENILFSEDAQ